MPWGRRKVKFPQPKSCASDRRMNGYSYSGTIGMAPGVDFVRAEPMTEREAEIYCFGKPDPEDKWGWIDGKARKYDNALLIKLDDGRWFIGAECSC